MRALVALLVGLAAGFQGRGIPPELLEKAQWVAGRVVPPEHTPPDERIEVVAHAAGLPAFNDHAALIGADGRFRVAFAHDARRGRLTLRARYAVLEPAPAWKRGAEETERTLTPVLGAWLSGRVTGAQPGEFLRHGEIVLSGRPTQSGGLIVERRVVPGADGAFDAGGLACDRIWSATISAEGHRTAIVDPLPLEAGHHAQVAWKLDRGATVAGRVVDEGGRPVTGARLHFECRSEPFAPLPAEIADGCTTRADGAFRATGLYAGDVLLRVECEGFVPRTLVLSGLGEGEAREALDVALSAGVSVRGRVVGPDGAPAAGASVRVTQALPGFKDIVRETAAAGDGSFACAGFAPSPVRIAVDRRGEGRRFQAELAGVDPGATDLLVHLVERYAIRGRVLDDAGRTVLSYTAGVRRLDPAHPDAPQRTVDVKGGDGVFVIDDLDAGSFEVFAYGRGIVWEPARRIDLPAASGEIVFVLRRPAVVSGVVTGANGEPVAHALVEARWERTSLFGGVKGTENTSVTTSPEGRFELTEVYPGRVTLIATGEDGRTAEAVVVELASGEKRSDVSIRFGR